MMVLMALATIASTTNAAFLSKQLAARSLSAESAPPTDPHCKTGIISLKVDGKPQSCCAGYCGACNDYETCKSVNGQASENACCASKVYEMRCGNAPANVCLKTCSEAVPPCIMDKEFKAPKVKAYKGVPPCNEIVPFQRKRQADAMTKGKLQADLHMTDSNLQEA